MKTEKASASAPVERLVGRFEVTPEQGKAAVELLLRLRRHGLRAAWENKESECAIFDDAVDLLDEVFGPDFDFHGET